MTRTHFRVIDEDGDTVYVGPGRGFPSHLEAVLFLILVPDCPTTWRVVPFDPDALPLPPTPRYPA